MRTRDGDSPFDIRTSNPDILSGNLKTYEMPQLWR